MRASRRLGGPRHAAQAPALRAEPDAARLSSPKPVQIDGNEACMKILVVDDSATMRRLIARSLEKLEGQEVEIIEAADGMRALAAVEHHGPSIDLILCDMNMPNVDGLSLLKSLRSSRELRGIPFVVVTADRSDERTAQALRQGAAGVVGKPFEPELIVNLLRKRGSRGRRATSSVFKTEHITGMIRSMSRSARGARKES